MKRNIFLMIVIALFFIGCQNSGKIYIEQKPVIVYKYKYKEPKKVHKVRKVYHNIKKNNYNSYSSHKTKTYSNKITQKAYFVRGKWYYPISVYKGEVFRGLASWYGPNFHGKLSANGEIYNMYHYTAANKILPLGTRVKVINLKNHKSVVVRINDRGPFVKGRIIDLSYIAGKRIGIDKTGTAPVKLIVLSSPVLSKNHKNSSSIHKTKYYKIKIQVGAFKSYKGAKLRQNKYKGFHTYIAHKNGKYKVYITGFKTREEAENFKNKYRISGFITIH